MKDGKQSRREFLRGASAAVAGAAIARARAAEETPATQPKILNYNPKMGYRRLGKTGFMISEVSLGGHGKGYQLLDHAAELGMNYVDTNIVGECDCYGSAMAGMKTARRDKWFIGFASWPQKVTEDYEKSLTADKMMASIEGRLKSYRTDMLDLWRPVGATWGAGQNSIPTMLMVTPGTLELIVEVFEKARKQGKVRFLGISAHNPKVFRRVLGGYPQFSVIIFPYLFLTKELGGGSLLELAKEKDVGVIGLKPFGAGTTFGLRPQHDKVFTDKRAHAMVKTMLSEPRISAVIPGVGAKQHLDENVKGSYERDKPLTPKERQALREFAENYHAHLPAEYQWLRQWETV